MYIVTFIVSAIENLKQKKVLSTDKNITMIIDELNEFNINEDENGLYYYTSDFLQKTYKYIYSINVELEKVHCSLFDSKSNANIPINFSNQILSLENLAQKCQHTKHTLNSIQNNIDKTNLDFFEGLGKYNFNLNYSISLLTYVCKQIFDRSQGADNYSKSRYNIDYNS